MTGKKFAWLLGLVLLLALVVPQTIHAGWLKKKVTGNPGIQDNYSRMHFWAPTWWRIQFRHTSFQHSACVYPQMQETNATTIKVEELPPKSKPTVNSEKPGTGVLAEKSE